MYSRVAAISADDDDAIGWVVVCAPHTVGNDGTVTVEEIDDRGLEASFVEDF